MHGEIYFITLTVVGWIDVFTRLSQKQVIIESLEYCQKHKGLELYGYCLMSNHIHLLCKAPDKTKLADIVRNFKTHTSKQIIKNILDYPESRRDWMLEYFERACSHLKRKQRLKVWKDGYHAEVTQSNWFIRQKLDYIHNNPVKQKIVLCPEEYYFSSARNYAGLPGELEIVRLDFNGTD